MIFDTFMYNGEEDILDIRLNTLDPIVDKFILIESPYSHSRLPRELEYSKQKDRFKKFENKINYYVIDYCKNDNFLLNDWMGREVIEDILINKHNLKLDDIIIHGDLDEIPRLELLQKVISSDASLEKPYTFMNNSRQLCFDLELRQPFFGSILIKGEHLTKHKLYWLRQIRLNSTINGISYKDTFNFIENGGWHFSYCAGIERTVDKFRFYCHAKEMDECIRDKEGLINCIKNKISFDTGKTPLFQVDFNNENMPKYILDNPKLFKENLSFYY
jgi:beta-1,4-mannosyl-glycoprotein beta-1,4-N-acetylglucosaminyltransferase